MKKSLMLTCALLLWASPAWAQSIISQSDTILTAAIAVDGADSDEVVAAVTGKKIRVLGYLVACSAATDLTWEDEDGTDFTGTINLVANGNLTVVAPASPLGYFQTTTAAKALHLLKSGAVDCDGHLTYVEVD